MLLILAGQITTGSGAATEMCTFAVSLGKPSGGKRKKRRKSIFRHFLALLLLLLLLPPSSPLFFFFFFFSVSARKEGIKYGLLQGGLSERKRCTVLLRLYVPSLPTYRRAGSTFKGGGAVRRVQTEWFLLFPPLA